MAEKIRVTVNGTAREVVTERDRSLLQVLREDLDLTGAKYGCGEGSCGACTVLLDGEPIRSCITPVGEVGNQPVVTIEGLAKDGVPHPVQQAFLDADALQCGYCTPGMILSAVALLKENPNPDETAIATGLQGNVCRCGTYRRIVQAVQAAAKAPGRTQR